jgi:peptidoglycan L-alanyl-D-glutamate endopeptidase CwlK
VKSSRYLEDLAPVVYGMAIVLIARGEMELSSLFGANIKLKVLYTYRDGEFQDSLYAQGRTKPGKIVTNAKAGESMHQYRCAFDVAIFVDGALTWEHKYYEPLGLIAQEIGLTWGGDWDGDGKKDRNDWDLCHFQWTGGLTLADLQAGKELPA